MTTPALDQKTQEELTNRFALGFLMARQLLESTPSELAAAGYSEMSQDAACCIFLREHITLCDKILNDYDAADAAYLVVQFLTPTEEPTS